MSPRDSHVKDIRTGLWAARDGFQNLLVQHQKLEWERTVSFEICPRSKTLKAGKTTIENAPLILAAGFSGTSVLVTLDAEGVIDAVRVRATRRGLWIVICCFTEIVNTFTHERTRQ